MIPPTSVGRSTAHTTSEERGERRIGARGTTLMCTLDLVVKGVPLKSSRRRRQAALKMDRIRDNYKSTIFERLIERIFLRINADT
jgi:hypothetical protein